MARLLAVCLSLHIFWTLHFVNPRPCGSISLFSVYCISGSDLTVFMRNATPFSSPVFSFLILLLHRAASTSKDGRPNLCMFLDPHTDSPSVELERNRGDLISASKLGLSSRAHGAFVLVCRSAGLHRYHGQCGSVFGSRSNTPAIVCKSTSYHRYSRKPILTNENSSTLKSSLVPLILCDRALVG